MANSYSSNCRLRTPAANDAGWAAALDANRAFLDALSSIGALCVVPQETPSSTRTALIAAGSYLDGSGGVSIYAGGSITVGASVTTRLWLDSAGALQSSTSAWPGTAHVRLAVVISGTTTITSVTDHRQPFVLIGGFIGTGGGTLADAADLVLGTTTGSKLGTGATQKLGFWGATPVVRPAHANQAALTDSTGGTAGTTISDVGGSYSQSTINNNLASVVRLVNQLRSDLVAAGLIKGSA